MNDLLNLLKGVAPTLAMAVAGPLGASAVTALASKFGVSDSVDAVAKAIAGDPAATAKLAEVEADFAKAELEAVTKRWEADMKSDSYLSKNIRPLILIYITVIFTALAFTDGNIGEFQIAKEYIPIFQTLLVTVYGAYFVGRTWEKAKKINKK